MLLPEFTIRSLFIVTAVCAAFFAVVGFAVRGSAWAVAMAAPLAIIAGTLLMQMGAYAMALLLSKLRSPTGSQTSDPFASTQPSEQVIPTQEKEW